MSHLLTLVRRLGLLAGLCAAALAGLPLPVASAASRTAEQSLVTFGIGPAGATRADGRALFRYTVPAGGVLRDQVAVVNQSDRALTLIVYPSDATTGPTGGLEIAERAVRNRQVGAWITLGPAVATGRLDPTARSVVQVTVPPQRPGRGPGQVLLPMRIAVPADASPGDHVGGVAVALVARGSSPGAQNVDLEQRVVSRIYLDVPGTRTPGLDVEVLDTHYAGGSGLGLQGMLDVTYRLRNTGNVRLGATTALSADGPFGVGHWDAVGKRVDELLPGSAVVLTTRVFEVWPTVLGTVRVTAKAVAAPAGEQVQPAPAGDSARYWAITWQEVAALLALLAYLFHRRWRRARSRPRHAKEDPPVLELVGSGALVVLLLGAVLAVVPGEAHAATTLGQVEASPTVGTDQTLVDGAVADARCPRGTGDSYFTADGPGLAPNTAFLGFGNSSGTGYASFRGASIANIRTANAGAFDRSGRYTIRFSCVRAADGRVSASYTRELEYRAGGAGSFRLVGYPRTGPTRFPLPSGAAGPSPTAVPTAGPRTSAGATPSATTPGASPEPGGATTAAPGRAPFAGSATAGSPSWWLPIGVLGVVSVVAALAALSAHARRSRDRRP